MVTGRLTKRQDVVTDSENTPEKPDERNPEGVPNLFRTLKANPAVLSGFEALDGHLTENGRLTEAERMLVGLMTALESDCAYCRAALSKEARDAGAHDPSVRAVLSCELPENPRERLLVQAARRIIELRGRLPRSEIAHFARQGLDEPSLLEVIAVVGEFVIATYANNLMRTRIDPEYRGADETGCQC